jgi:alpha-amylase
MASVVLYFQVHQPYRLRRYSSFDTHGAYFDEARNAEILRKVAEKCYRPATRLLLGLLQKHRPFRISFSLSGTVVEQLQDHAPDVLGLFGELVATGRCELLGETYHHSLACMYSRREFLEQVERHTRLIHDHFGVIPSVFRNTELLYSNDTARMVATMRDPAGRQRFTGMLAEGVERNLGGRTPDGVHQPPAAAGTGPFRLLLRNYRLSDDIAFRFSNRAWEEWPLTPAKFAARLRECSPHRSICNLFMDYETFGEHQWEESGIFDFLAGLPEAVLARGGGFLTPSGAVGSVPGPEEYDAPEITSWADSERDVSAWCGNGMQTNAAEEHARLGESLRDALDRAGSDEARANALERRLEDWRRLSTSDHFYYMSTKYFADGDVHKYFNPYESPYDSYINFMNVLDDLRTRVTGAVPTRTGVSV